MNRDRIANLEIKRVPIDSLVMDPANPRTHGPKNLDSLKGSLTLFGQAEPLVVQKSTRKIIGGNGRLQAMKDLGWTECDIVEVDLTGSQAVALGITLNRTSELAEWNNDILAAQLSGLTEDGWSAADLEGIGFDPNDLADLEPTGGDVTEDEVPEPPAVAVTKPGDLYLLGKHRLLCGDSTKADDVARVMAGEKADLILTSPPYPGADMWDKSGEQAQDRISRLDELNRNLLASAFNTLTEGGVCCWNVADVPFGNHGTVSTTTTTTHIACREIGFVPRSVIVWDKGTPVLPPPAFMRRPVVCAIAHELVMIFYKGDWIPREKTCGIDEEDKQWLLKSVWPIPTAKASEFGHPAPFPVELARRCISLWSISGERVLDLCAGSGTTIVVSEQLGRRCFGLEIEPRYCDVIVKRWETLAGRKATLEERR